MTTRLDIVGCGRVGRTLARLWNRTGSFEIGHILNRSFGSGSEAVDFIGAGRAAQSLTEFAGSGVVLIATGDDQIENRSRALARVGVLRPGSVVFHCSGALTCEALAAVREAGASIASVHPVKSFASPDAACRSFAGTYCGIEGDESARDRLRPSFEAIGGRLFDVDARFKTIYHAGAVIACNYLVSIAELGLRCYEKAGVPRDTAADILRPLVSETVENVFSQGAANALTGPIARGEVGVVAGQLAALARWDPRLADLYARLGSLTVEISRAQASASPDALAELQRLLEDQT